MNKQQTIIHNHRGWLLELKITVTPYVPCKTPPFAITDQIEQCILLENDKSGKGSVSDTIFLDNGDSLDADLDYEWRRLELDYDIIGKIALWEYNHNSEEALSLKLFEQYFGKNMGKHLYHKWLYPAQRNIFWMMRYLKTEPDKGQKFCNILMQQVELYQKRQNETE